MRMKELIGLLICFVIDVKCGDLFRECAIDKLHLVVDCSFSTGLSLRESVNSLGDLSRYFLDASESSISEDNSLHILKQFRQIEGRLSSLCPPNILRNVYCGEKVSISDSLISEKVTREIAI